VPVIVILAVAWGIGRLARQNELTAMRAAGVAPGRIAAPLLAACVVLACVVFVLNERVVTRTQAYVREEALLLRKKSEGEVLERQYFYTDDKQGKLYFERYRVMDKVMEEVIWGRPATEASPRLQVFAKRAEWLGGQWWLFDVQVSRRDRLGNEELSPMCAKRIMYEWELPPEYIAGEKDPEERTLGELNQAIRRERVTQPESALKNRLERHYRFALPVLAVLMLVLSFPLVMSTGRGRGAAAALGVSLVLCFAYYGFYAAMRAVAIKAGFPPMVWVPNIAYGAAGVVLFLRVR